MEKDIRVQYVEDLHKAPVVVTNGTIRLSEIPAAVVAKYSIKAGSVTPFTRLLVIQ